MCYKKLPTSYGNKSNICFKCSDILNLCTTCGKQYFEDKDDNYIDAKNEYNTNIIKDNKPRDYLGNILSCGDNVIVCTHNRLFDKGIILSITNERAIVVGMHGEKNKQQYERGYIFKKILKLV